MFSRAIILLHQTGVGHTDAQGHEPDKQHDEDGLPFQSSAEKRLHVRVANVRRKCLLAVSLDDPCDKYHDDDSDQDHSPAATVSAHPAATPSAAAHHGLVLRQRDAGAQQGTVPTTTERNVFMNILQLNRI